MSARLSKLLEHALAGEPALADEVDAVFRRADRLRRRRTRVVLAAGVTAAAAVATAGVLLVTALLPDAHTPPPPPSPPVATAPATPVPSAAPDPVLAVIAPEIAARKLRIHPRPPERGNGWRQYAVTSPAGDPRGIVQVAVYQTARKLCFPVLAAPDACARTEKTAAGLEYLRYDDDQDSAWLTRQTIAHRRSDGRTIALMATGERKGRPPLSGTQVQKLATTPALLEAFGRSETCTGPAASACPTFRVPVPTPH